MMNTQTTSLSTIIPKRAAGYIRNGDTIWNAENNVALRPSGAFVSNITDLIKWEISMENFQFLPQQVWQQMWTDTVKTPDNSRDGTPIYYGYGWSISKLGNRKLISHSGSLQGFRTMYYRFLSEKTAIIILTNSEPANTGQIASGVADIILR